MPVGVVGVCVDVEVCVVVDGYEGEVYVVAGMEGSCWSATSCMTSSWLASSGLIPASSFSLRWRTPQRTENGGSMDWTGVCLGLWTLCDVRFSIRPVCVRSIAL